MHRPRRPASAERTSKITDLGSAPPAPPAPNLRDLAGRTARHDDRLTDAEHEIGEHRRMLASPSIRALIVADQARVFSRSFPSTLEPSARRCTIQAMQIKPNLDRVLILRDDQKMSAGGLHLPDSKNREKVTVIGTIEAIGPGAVGEDGVFREVKRKVGDKVLLTAYAGAVVELGDRKDRVIVRDHEILADVEQ